MKTYNALAAIFVASAILFGIKVKSELLDKSSSLKNVHANEVIQSFTLPDTDGTNWELHATAKDNKVVLINFWATWCTPCRLEMPQFEKLYLKHKEAGLEILAINCDEEQEDVEKYLQKSTISFPVLLDREGDVAKRYGVRAYPTSILIDKTGKVLEVYEGVQPYLEYQVEFLLEQGSGSD